MIKDLNPDAIKVLPIPTTQWHRIYDRQHGALGFNGTMNGNARFSPIVDKAGAIIPTLYGANSISIALMETVLHDVPTPSHGFILQLPPASQETRDLAVISNKAPLKLVDFSSIGLRSLGLTRSAVIDSDKPHYPDTRLLAQWVYQHKPEAQGIRWTSRQDDSGAAIVLFGNRLRASDLTITKPGRSISEDDIQDELLDLLNKLGAGLVYG